MVANNAAPFDTIALSEAQKRHQRQKNLPVNKNKNRKNDSKKVADASDASSNVWMSWGALAVLLIISYIALPSDLRPTQPTIQHVFYYGWVTALSTGLGAVPLFFADDVGKTTLGVCNGLAAGMMLSASTSLIYEGIMLEESVQYEAVSQMWRVAIGVVSGLLFIVSTQQILDKYEDLKLCGLQGADAKKVLLIIFVMTLHSFSEGVGIGVSFGGLTGAQLGVFISATLAVHNVPEGLAVALVLNPRKVSKLNSALWCVFTSLPQPLMAVPAYLFIEHFIPLLPVGLGFAAGAMAWVAVFELFAEAIEDTNKLTAVLTSGTAFLAMFYVQGLIKEE